MVLRAVILSVAAVSILAYTQTFVATGANELALSISNLSLRSGLPPEN
jgi:hypothetical protein